MAVETINLTLIYSFHTHKTRTGISDFKIK